MRRLLNRFLLRSFVLIAVAVLSPAIEVAHADPMLDSLMQKAVSENHDLRAARAQIDSAIGRLVQAGLWPNPRLQLSNETGVPFASDGTYSTSVAFAQDFPIAGRLARAEDVARVDVARALAELNDAERKLLGDVAATYYAIAAIDEKLKTRDELIEIETSLVSASSARYRAGEVSALDVNAVKLDLDRLQQDRALLEADRITKLKVLASLLGSPPDVPLEANARLPDPKTLPPIDELTRVALARRPDLRLLMLGADRARAEQALAESSAWEDWTVSVGVKQDRLFVLGAPSQPADKALMVTLSIPFPVFNRNQGTRASAAADEVTAREQAEALRLRIGNDIAAEYARIVALASVVGQYRESTLPLGRKNVALARNAYRAGQLSMTDVVQATRQEIDLNNSYVDALSNYLIAVSELDTSTVAQESLLTRPEATVIAGQGRP